MSKKSLEEIWRRIESERRDQAQREAQRERELFEKRELARREYLNRVRMFEKVGPNTPTSAASSAAGGGRIPTPETPIIGSQESFLYYDWDSGNNIFSYFIVNFETGYLTDIKTIENFENNPTITEVTGGGFFLQSDNLTNSNQDLAFITLNGEVIWEDVTDNTVNVDIEDFVRYVAAYYLKGGIWKLVVFDKDSNIKTFEFENEIEGGGYSYDQIWSEGFVVKEFIGTVQKYYIINFELATATQFKEIDTDLGDSLSVFLYSYSDKIVTRQNNTLFEVWNSIGEKISEFDIIGEFSTSSWSQYSFTFLEDGGGFILFGDDSTNNQWGIIKFNSDTLTFISRLVDRSIYGNCWYELGDQKNYRSRSNWIAEGTSFFLFYDSTADSTPVLNYYNNASLLPIWSSDSDFRDFYTFSNADGLNFGVSNVNSGVIVRNSDNICLLGDNFGDSNYSILKFDRLGTSSISDSGIPKTWDRFEDFDYMQDKTVIQLYKNLTISNVNYGWGDLSDVEDRFYYSFRRANNGNIGNFVLNREFIMKDIVNDQYWAIKFTNWEVGDMGGDGGFAYTRQLIEGGTFSGEAITFTYSSFLDSPDVIVPGVLEIKRDEYGPIYNSAVEGESNRNNPIGTLWNSQYSSQNIQEYVHIIINRSGEVIGEVVTGEDFSDSRSNKIYTLEDRVFNSFYVSNETTVSGLSPSIPGQFQLLDSYYDNSDISYSSTFDTGLIKSNFLLNTGLKFRFVTENKIGDEVIIPMTGIFTKVDGSEAFETGFYVTTDDGEHINFYVFNLESSLVFQKSILNSDLNTWSFDTMGKRMSIRYKLNSGNWYVIVFDGQIIQEVDFGSKNSCDVWSNDTDW